MEYVPVLQPTISTPACQQDWQARLQSCGYVVDTEERVWGVPYVGWAARAVGSCRSARTKEDTNAIHPLAAGHPVAAVGRECPGADHDARLALGDRASPLRHPGRGDEPQRRVDRCGQPTLGRSIGQ